MKRILAAVVLALVVASPVFASSATTSDPAGDTRTSDGKPAGGGVLDVVSVAHDNTAETVKYAVQTNTGFTDGQVGLVAWFLQYEGDTVCASIQVRVRQLGTGLGGDVIHCRVVNGQPTEDVLGPASVTHAAGAASIAVSYPRSYFAKAGVATDGNQYFMSARGSDQHTDQVPNSGLIVHSLNGSSGGFTSATPAPSSTASVTASPVAGGASPVAGGASPAASGAPRSTLKPVTPAPVRKSPGAAASPSASPTTKSATDKDHDRLFVIGLALGALALVLGIITAATRRKRRPDVW